MAGLEPSPGSPASCPDFHSPLSRFSPARPISPLAPRGRIPQLLPCSSSLGCALSPWGDTDPPALSLLTRLNWGCEASHCHTRGLPDEIISQALSLLAVAWNHPETLLIPADESNGPRQPHILGQATLGEVMSAGPLQSRQVFSTLPLVHPPAPLQFLRDPFFSLVFMKPIVWSDQG